MKTVSNVYGLRIVPRNAGILRLISHTTFPSLHKSYTTLKSEVTANVSRMSLFSVICLENEPTDRSSLAPASFTPTESYFKYLIQNTERVKLPMFHLEIYPPRQIHILLRQCVHITKCHNYPCTYTQGEFVFTPNATLISILCTQFHFFGNVTQNNYILAKAMEY